MHLLGSVIMFAGAVWFTVGVTFALTGFAYSGMRGLDIGLVAAAPTCLLPGGVLLSLGAFVRVFGRERRIARRPQARAPVRRPRPATLVQSSTIPPWERGR